MALDLTQTYPAQIDDTDPAYPWGKARNANSPDDTNGTPLEAQWLNDVWGSRQALLDAASILPSGSPDQVGASDVLTAIQTLISSAVASEVQKRVAAASAWFAPSGSGGENAKLALTKLGETGASFDLANDEITLPAGTYLVALRTSVSNNVTATETLQMGVDLRIGGSAVITALGRRYSDEATHFVPLVGFEVVTITDPPNEKLSLHVVAGSVGNTVVAIDSAPASNRLVIVRLTGGAAP